MRKLFLIFLLGFSLTFSGCSWFESKPIFKPIPDEILKTISGTLFPFSVSVSTNATHRLEKDGKLVGYIASDIVKLKKFENQEVDIEGVWRHEKMHQIFWVERIHVKVKEKIEEIKIQKPQYNRFKMKDFSFKYPIGWSHTITPDDKAHFINKEDPQRRVFLTFSVRAFSSEEKKIEPNILINDFSGTKTITIEKGNEKEDVKLFSQKGVWEYRFVSQVKMDDFERKKEISKLIMSFVEGEENVQKAILEDKKLLAKEEESKIEKVEVLEDAKNEEKPHPNPLLEGEGTKNDSKKVEKNLEEAKGEETENNPEEVTKYKLGEYEEKIDNRAYSYSNSYRKMSLRVPYGFWYRGLGAQYGSVYEMGIAKHPVHKYSDAEIFVKIFYVDKPFKEMKEGIIKDRVILTKMRDEKTAYEVSGPLKYRDEMWSIFNTLK